MLNSTAIFQATEWLGHDRLHNLLIPKIPGLKFTPKCGLQTASQGAASANPKVRVGDILRKEVIQPQVPLRLPCYDLVPIAEFIFGAWLLTVTAATSDAPHFRGLTGGVYKAQEHIHRGMLTRDY